MSPSVTPGAIVFVDTNVIIEAHRTRSWAALTGAYRIETVEDCVTETQTGFSQRRPREQIDPSDLIASLAAVHQVTNEERVALTLLKDNIALDSGEESLWSYARSRMDLWFLCGPDRASLRVGLKLDFRERLVSLEELLQKAGHKSRLPLKTAYTRKWLDRVMSEMVVAETLNSGHSAP